MGHRNIWFHAQRREARLEYHFSTWSGTPADLEAMFGRLASEGWEGLRLNFSPADEDSDGDGGLWITGGRKPTPDDEQKIAAKNRDALNRHERLSAWHREQAEQIRSGIRSGGWDTTT